MTTGLFLPKRILILCLVAWTVGAGFPQRAMADVYYWNAGAGYAAFGTLSNWSTGGTLSAGGTAATALPGENDFIACEATLSGAYFLGSFDLGGATQTIKGWSPASLTWQYEYVKVRNGTLVVKEPSDTASGAQTKIGRLFIVEKNGRLVYPDGRIRLGYSVPDL